MLPNQLKKPRPKIEPAASRPGSEQPKPTEAPVPSLSSKPVQETLPLPINPLDEVLTSSAPAISQAPASGPVSTSSSLEGETAEPARRHPPRKPEPKDSQLKKSLAKAWLAGKDFRGKVDSGAKKVTYKVAPKLAVQKPSVSPSLMLFIAIAIPIIIVAIATTIYIQKGRSTQHAYYVQQAELSVNYALETQDLNAKIAYWEAALNFIDQAESYGIAEDSTSLRNAIQQNLDMLGGMSHLLIRPAISETTASLHEDHQVHHSPQ